MEFQSQVPVPFTDATTLALWLDEVSDVSVQVFDVSGQIVKTLRSGTLDAGPHDIVWDGRRNNGNRAAPGIYFVRCSASGHQQVRRVVLIR